MRPSRFLGRVRRRSFVPVLTALCVGVVAATMGQSSAKPSYGKWGIDTSGVSRTVKPGDDFYAYVNEGWLKRTPIPKGLWDYGQFTAVERRNDARVREIVRQAARSSTAMGSPGQQIGDLFRSYRDERAIERTGLRVVRREIAAILANKGRQEVARFMADSRSSSLVAANVFPDPNDNRRQIVWLDQLNLNQPILGLGGREAYERKDADFPSRRSAYVEYVARVLGRFGVANPRRRAQRVLELEGRLASHQWDLNRLRDRRANNHPVTLTELEVYAPGFPWRVYLRALGLSGERRFILGTDGAVRAQARVFAGTPVETWNAYLAFHWLQNQIELLPRSLRLASDGFYRKGFKEDRENAAVGYVNRTLGPLVGKLYVQRHLDINTRAAAIELFGYLRRAFAESLAGAEWMDEETKAEARAKLATFRFKIGFPERWRDFRAVRIAPNDLYGNARRVREAAWHYQRGLLGKPTDRDRWFQSPQNTGASFSVLLNAIELPAGLLQPPFLDPGADPAVNFGAIGAIIGHEMGHGFDDQGALFDRYGRMRDWWTRRSRAAFRDRTDALARQYGAFEPLPGLRIDGRRTIGENIGDLSGVSLAYRAYRLYLREHSGGRAPVLDGTTGDQRFFMSWAQAWAYQAPESAIRYIVTNDYHSPAQYRVNGVVRNLDAWYEAFGIGPGSSLYLPPQDRVRIW